MRFVSYIICASAFLQMGFLQIGFLGGYAHAQTRAVQSNETVVPIETGVSAKTKAETANGDYRDLTLPTQSAPPRLQKGQRVDKLQTVDGLDIKRFARRLGDIQSVSRGAQGQLYTTDARTGRVFIIPDSDQNGRPEQIRALPYRFDTPSAAIEMGAHIYIADKQAIWKLPKARAAFQDPQPLASLKNTQSRGAYFLVPHFPAPSTASSYKTAQLILGYSSQDGKARIISVDTQTGHAKLISEAAGRLEQLTPIPGSKPWMVYRNQQGLHMGTSFEGSTALGQALDIRGITIARSDALAENWPKSLRNHIFMSRGNPVTVTAMPSAFGAVLPRGREVFSGFQNSRTAWGQAGALHIDKRGLFVADPFNGDIWRVFAPLKPKDKTGADSIDRALGDLKAAQIKAETPLKSDPLKSVYDTRFPVSSNSKDTAVKDPQLENNPAPSVP